MTNLQKNLIQEVRTYARSQQIDLILADGVIYVKNDFDVTSDVLNQLNGRSLTARCTDSVITRIGIVDFGSLVQKMPKTPRKEDTGSVQKEIIQTARSYALSQGFDLVLADGIIYATSAIDLTPAVLTRLRPTP
jgi:Skp family chaperone for outer membrane proteins